MLKTLLWEEERDCFVSEAWEDILLTELLGSLENYQVDGLL